MSWSVNAKNTDKTKLLADVEAHLAPAEANYRKHAESVGATGSGLTAAAEADDVAYARKRIAMAVEAATPWGEYTVIAVNAYGSVSETSLVMHVSVTLEKLAA